MPREVLTVACKEQSNVTGAAPESLLDDFGQDGHDDSIDDLPTKDKAKHSGRRKKRMMSEPQAQIDNMATLIPSLFDNQQNKKN